MKPNRTELEVIKELTKNFNTTENDYFIFEATVTNNMRDRLLDYQSAQFVKGVASQLVGKPLLLDHEYDTKNTIGLWFDSYLNIDPLRIGADGNNYTEAVGRAFILNNEANKDIISKVEHGLIKGTSIGFQCDYHAEDGEFIGLKNLLEVSLTPFPCLFDTEIKKKSTAPKIAKQRNFGIVY